MQADGFSIAAQERAIRAYCDAQGWTLAALYIDQAKSARSDDITKRPEFARMLEAADDRMFDVVVVHKLDRFARNLVTTITTLQRLEKSGVSFVSISEQMDFTSPIGKAMLAMLAAFAQYYSDNLSSETKKGKAERRKQGLYNGVLSYGYTRGPDGVPIPDTVPIACHRETRLPIAAADGLHLIFQLAANGESDRNIARILNRRGYVTTGNRDRNRFAKDAVRTIVGNRFYLGELPDGNGGWIPGRHEPMIDELTFERAQEHRRQRAGRAGSVTSGVTVTPYTGLMVCGTCGSSMRRQSRNHYRCSRNVQGAGCTERGISEDLLEEQILILLDAITVRGVDADLLLQDVREFRQQMREDVAIRSELEARELRLRQMFLDAAITIDEYREEYARLEEDLRAMPDMPDIPDEQVYIDEAMRHLSNLRNTWLQCTGAERNELLKSLFSALYVQNRTVVALLPRPDFQALLSALFAPHRAQGRERRASDTHVRRWAPGVLAVPSILFADARRYSGGGRYEVSRRWKLTPADVMTIRRMRGHSLRQIAKAVGVSHETVRQVLQD